MKTSLHVFASYYLVLACAVWFIVGLLNFASAPDKNLWFVLFMTFTWILPSVAGIYVFFARKLYQEGSERPGAHEDVTPGEVTPAE